jgi:hypothetical protein
MTGRQTSGASDPDTGSTIGIEPGAVLATADAIERQADVLGERLAGASTALRISPPAQDTVSVHAIDAWNTIIATGDASYAERVASYVERLRGLAEQLRAAARGYQHGDAGAAERVNLNELRGS